MDNKEVFSRNLVYYMELKQKSRKEVADTIKVSYFTFTDWVKGKTYPRMDKVEKLAKYFNIKISDLVEPRLRSVQCTEPQEHDKSAILMSLFDSLNEIGQDKAIEHMEMLHKIYPKEEPILNAAHERTDIEITDEMRKHDDDIMDDEDF